MGNVTKISCFENSWPDFKRFIFHWRSQVTRLYYHVQINNKTTEPWEDRIQPAKLEEILAKLLQNDSSLRDLFVLNNQSETQVYTLFIEGHQRDLSDIQTAIKSSWQDLITSGTCCPIIICMKKMVWLYPFGNKT